LADPTQWNLRVRAWNSRSAQYPETVNKVPRWLLPTILGLLVLVVLVGSVMH
jgi:hypothetical protein